MSTHCPTCGVPRTIQDPRLVKTVKGRYGLAGRCPVCGGKLFKSVVAAVVGAMLIGATAAQAVQDGGSSAAGSPGPVETVESIEGEASTEVERALSVRNVEITGARDGSAVVNEDGTRFITHARVAAGDNFGISLEIANSSEKKLTAALVMQGPAGFDIQLSTPEAGQVKAVPMGGGEWLLEVPSEGDTDGDGGNLTISVDVPMSTPPGEQSLSFAITPSEL